MKCKDYSKTKDKRYCKHFLGNKVIELDTNLEQRQTYEIIESCKCRCALGKEAK